MPRPTLALLLAMLACASPPRALDPQHAPVPVSLCADGGACTDTVAVTYLGGDGFLIRRDDSAVLTPPLFTRRSLVATILPLTFRSQQTVVDRGVAQLGARFGDVGLVLAGHAHYDHLLDVPSLAKKFPDSARIVGGTTVKNILSADSASRVRTFEVTPDQVGSAERVGTWIYSADRRSRVMALASDHAPNWLFITYAWGTVERPRTTLPRTGWGWKLGEVYAFVIDFIAADSTPEFRLVFQDAVSRPEFNVLPPFAGRDRHAVNVAIVSAGNFKKAPRYPDTLLDNLQPERVIVGHWDDFFDAFAMEPDVVAMTNPRKLRERLETHAPDRWMTPYPGAVMKYAFTRRP